MLVCIVVYFVLMSSKRSQRPPASLPQTVMIFSSFGISNSFRPTCWFVGSNAHAEWFVPDVSGRLADIVIAIEPGYARKGQEQTAGDLNLFLATDENGFPGKILEQFSLTAGAPTSAPPLLPLVFKSASQPELMSGAKFWLCAKSSGMEGWVWHFGDPKMVRKAAREKAPGMWASAGDFCYCAAFSVNVITNQALPGIASGNALNNY